MEREFVSYEQAVALKELGFTEKCFAFTPGIITPPLKQQVFRWFREKYELYYRITGVKQSKYHYSIDYQYKDGKWGLMAGSFFDTYEEAEDACIDKLIELAKQQDK